MTAQTGVSPLVLKELETMGIGAGVLPYLHTIFPVFPAHLLRDLVKQWALSGMEGQCHKVRSYPSSSALISQSPILSCLRSLINADVSFIIACFITASALKDFFKTGKY